MRHQPHRPGCPSNTVRFKTRYSICKIARLRTEFIRQTTVTFASLVLKCRPVVYIDSQHKARTAVGRKLATNIRNFLGVVGLRPSELTFSFRGLEEEAEQFSF